jgi:putative ABC transport system permease protein
MDNRVIRRNRSLRPPKVAAFILSIIVDPPDLPFVSSDLQEEYEAVLGSCGQRVARRWYWSQVARSFRPQLVRRVERRGRPLAQAIVKNVRRLLTAQAALLDIVVGLGWDFRHGSGILMRTPLSAFFLVTTLAMAISVATVMFCIAQGALFSPLPYQDAGHLMTIWAHDQGSQKVSASIPDFLDWQRQSTSFEDMALYSSDYGGYSGGGETVLGGTEPARAVCTLVSEQFFPMLRVAPFIGRTLSPGDFRPQDFRDDARPAVVVSYEFWRRYLSGDPNLTGKTISIYDSKYDVVGVMPSGFSFQKGVDLWAPLRPSGDTSRSARGWSVIGRLKAGVTREVAAAEMASIGREMQRRYPDSNAGLGVMLTPLDQEIRGRAKSGQLFLLGAAAFLLLSACANVLYLILCRALDRKKDLAVRIALGASRARLSGQVLTESIFLAVSAGLLGLLLAEELIRLLVACRPANFPWIEQVTVNGNALAFVSLVCLGASLAFAAGPAVLVSKISIQSSKRRLLRGYWLRLVGAGPRPLLLIAEGAATVLLSICAGLLIKSYVRLDRADLGFKPGNVIATRIDLPGDYKEPHSKALFYRTLLGRIAGQAGVEDCGSINNIPLGGISLDGTFFIEGKAGDGGYAGYRIASPGYFRTMGIPLVAGRMLAEFDGGDSRTSIPVALINESLARNYFPGINPLGKRIRTGGMDSDGRTWVTVVGVVGDVRHYGARYSAMPEYYLPYAQRPARCGSMTVVVRSNADPGDLKTGIRSAVADLDRNVPVEFVAVNDLIQQSTSDSRYRMLLIGIFSCVALLMSTTGIYGVLSYSVRRRSAEYGVRLALGARRSDLLKEIVISGLAVTAAGIVIGTLPVLVGASTVAGLLSGVHPRDPRTIITIALVAMAAGFLASYVPARRATRQQPLAAMRD